MPVVIPGPGQDVIPTSDDAASAWFQNLQSEFSANQRMITAPTDAAFLALVSTYVNDLVAATNPAERTAVTVAAKNASKAAAAVMARDIGRQLVAMFRSGVLSGALLETYGFRIPDLVPSSIPAPVTAPLLSVVSMISGQQQLRASDSATPDSRAKPFGASGLQLFRASGVTVPANGDGATFVGVYSRQPMIVMVPPALLGANIHYFARWVTARGLTGPWSLAASVVGT